MSAQSAIFNPSQTTSAASGDGFSVPRLTTTGRLAITFTAADKGMMVYDTTLNNLFIWNGSAWESVPASGDAGADGAVQFNDNGVVSGAANFYWSKVQQKVGIGTNSPNVELDVVGNSSITGDLTVDTSTLKVDSANNRVGVGTASPAAGAALSVLGTTSVSASDYTTLSTWASRFQAAANNQPSGILLSGLTSGGAVVPGSLHVEPVANSSRSALIATYAADSAVGYFAINRFSPSAGTTSQHFKIDDTGVATWSNVGGVAGTAMTLNSTGLGVGVTPSAFGANQKALQVGSLASIYNDAFNGAAVVGFNVYQSGNSTYNYIATGITAARYEQRSASHFWYSAGSGTAGNPITFTQAMTLDASGNLLVSGTSAYIRAGGRTQIVSGSIVDINTVGNNVGIAFGGASSILPCDGSSTTTDGVANFGSASKRWNTIYASTGTINTSDQNEKQDIADLGDAEKRVAGKIKSLVKKYRFKDAVASKGENARIHVGWIAQDVQNAFSSEGLDASKYGVFCSDTWEENGVQKTRLGLRYDEVLAFVVSAI